MNPNRQIHLIAIMVMGTAILGIVLFHLDYASVSAPAKLWTFVRSGGAFPLAACLAGLKLVLAVLVAGHYLAMIRRVMLIKREISCVTDWELANGPVLHLVLEAGFSMVMFAVNVVQKPVSASLS